MGRQSDATSKSQNEKTRIKKQNKNKAVGRRSAEGTAHDEAKGEQANHVAWTCSSNTKHEVKVVGERLFKEQLLVQMHKRVNEGPAVLDQKKKKKNQIKCARCHAG